MSSIGFRVDETVSRKVLTLTVPLSFTSIFRTRLGIAILFYLFLFEPRPVALPFSLQNRQSIKDGHLIFRPNAFQIHEPKSGLEIEIARFAHAAGLDADPDHPGQHHAWRKVGRFPFAILAWRLLSIM